jgi:hypothetical protein
MKKIILIGIVATLVTMTTSAQVRPENRVQRFRVERGFQRGEINRPERFQLRKNQLRYRIAQKRVYRDGRVTPMERKRLMLMKRQNRQQMFRFKHNRFRRVI